MSASYQHYEQGKQCYQHKQFQDAIFQFTEAIRLGPDTPAATARCYNARGVVYFYLGEFRKVIKDCTKGLELEPGNANYYNCRGNAYFSLGKFAKAAEDFTKAIELSPQASHGRYFNNRGSAYRRLKMFREAVDDYSKAIAVDPKNGNYHNNRGNTYFDMGEFQRAIDDFTTALGLEPYSPKTKLTLAQAHEALAQEKRMKNASEFQGTFTHPKTYKEGRRTVVRLKERPGATVYVSPMGVEIAYQHGFLKKLGQHSFAWSEDMKIELVDEQSVRLTLDGPRQFSVLIAPCEASAVEEELIGRITTKFASYSTACLVAQHEGVVQEYTGIVAGYRKTQTEIGVLRSIKEEAEKQKEAFVKADKLVQANESKAQAAKLEEQIKLKESYAAQERTRAETVRQKAQQEAGPVLDMVLIMQNRVSELYQNKVRAAPDRYQPDDLGLKDQVAKMEGLVNRTRELSSLLARPIDEIESAMDRVQQAESDQEEEDDEDNLAELDNKAAASAAGGAKKAAPAAAAAAPAAAAAAAAAPASAGSTSSLAAASSTQDDEGSDWDDVDDLALPSAFAASGGEVFMTVESANGMVTITPSQYASQVAGVKRSEVVLVKKDELAGMSAAAAAASSGPQAARATPEELEAMRKAAEQAEQERRAREEAVRRMEETAEKLSAVRAEMEEMRRKVETNNAALASSDESGKAEAAKLQAQYDAELAALRSRQAELEQSASEKDAAVASLRATQEELERMKDEQVSLTAQLAQKQAALEASNSDLSGKLEMTALEKEQLEARVQAQSAEVQELAARLTRQKEEMHAASTAALATVRRVQELEAREAEYASELEQVRNQSEEEKARIIDQKAQLARQVEALESASKDMLDDLEGIKREKEELGQQVNEQAKSLSELRQHLANVQAALAKASAEAEAKQAALDQEKKNQEEQKRVISALEAQAAKEEAKRRELHNIIQEIKGNIRVYVRIRPSKAKREEAEVFRPVIGSDDRGLLVVGPEEDSAVGGKAKSKSWSFEFDRVFWPRHKQTDVFNEISQLVQSALDGYKVSIFAYGQTGAGKTHTMEGPDDVAKAPEMRGVIPRSVEQIFKYAAEMNEKGWEYKVSASFLEIYNTDIRDLLNYDPKAELEIKMIKRGKDTVTAVEGLHEAPVRSAEDVAPLILKANANRTSAATQMNDRSSRSHSVFQLNLVGRHEKSGQETVGVLNLVDLAGSERVEKSGAVGQRLEEAKAINTSLTCLGDVISSLARGDKHVPFRNSKLTYLLQDCFGSGSKTLMFINLSGEEEYLQESLCSLRFGAKVHETHIGPAKKTVKAAEPAKKK